MGRQHGSLPNGERFTARLEGVGESSREFFLTHVLKALPRATPFGPAAVLVERPIVPLMDGGASEVNHFHCHLRSLLSVVIRT